jgi:hypothetical protein
MRRTKAYFCAPGGGRILRAWALGPRVESGSGLKCFRQKGTLESKPPVALAALLRGNDRVGSCGILSSPTARPASG